MSITAATQRIAALSPVAKARIAGALYLTGIGNGYAGFVWGRLVVPGDAAATAHNLLAHETLYRVAFVADVIPIVYLAVIALFYELFKPVSRTLALQAAFFGLAGQTLWLVNSFLSLGALAVLGEAPGYGGFSAEQLQGLALLLLHLHGHGSNLVMLAFGCHILLLGWLIVRSTFLPRILGGLLAFAGVCYLTGSFASFLAPAFAGHLFPYIVMPGGIEIVLALWLLVRGVNAGRWHAQTGST